MLSLVLLFLLRFPGDNLLHKEPGYLHWSLLFLFQHFLDINYEQLHTHTQNDTENGIRNPHEPTAQLQALSSYGQSRIIQTSIHFFPHHPFPSLF